MIVMQGPIAINAEFIPADCFIHIEVVYDG